MTNSRFFDNKGCMFWIPVGLLMTLIGFAPGIVIAAIVDTISVLNFGQLWGTTLTTTIAILIGLYFYDNQRFHLRYLVLTVGVFVILFIMTLFSPDNFVFNIIPKMYPVVQTATEQFHNIFG